jgi:hypothetical protein
MMKIFWLCVHRDDDDDDHDDDDDDDDQKQFKNLG